MKFIISGADQRTLLKLLDWAYEEPRQCDFKKLLDSTHDEAKTKEIIIY